MCSQNFEIITLIAYEKPKASLVLSPLQMYFFFFYTLETFRIFSSSLGFQNFQSCTKYRWFSSHCARHLRGPFIPEAHVLQLWKVLLYYFFDNVFPVFSLFSLEYYYLEFPD